MKNQNIFSQEEIRRYNRQIILSEFGQKNQKKLKNAKVLVIGAGGLGCPVLMYLSAAGVGTIGILDYDIVDESNLHRQILFSSEDIDKPKVMAAKERLLKQNPFINYNTHFTKLNKNNAIEIIQNYDIVVEGSDNFSTKYLVNDCCVILNKPFVLGAINKFEGQLSVFNYKNGPTYRCFCPEPPDPLEAPTCSETGVIGVLPGIIGCLQANETIKIITGLGDVLSGKLLLFDSLTLNYNLFNLSRNDKYSNLKELGDYPDYCINDDQSIKQISATELKQKITNNDDIQIIDIREPSDYVDFNINGESIPMSEIPEKHNKISRTKQVVLICEYGIKCIRVINYLENKYGFTNLYCLSNGIRGWKYYFGEKVKSE
ncbi:MAG: molybdopterin-synthase adenylyltransferase MoeB [Bacteroidota bacterium]|nr:molybdopterin-synthase adenylyltransferase MoeB [Bacteroidota bacterium]